MPTPSSSNEHAPLESQQGLQGWPSWLWLIGLLVVCLAVGGLGGFATASEIDDWYRELDKPTWNPPDWIFGPVWSALYILMAVSAWLVVRRSGPRAAGLPLTIFSVQLLFNLAWSFIFFAAHQVGWAFFELLLLWGAIVATIVLFWFRQRLAAILLLPYLSWVTFAGILNFAIWRMNAS